MFDEEKKVEELVSNTRITDYAYKIMNSLPTKSSVKKAIKKGELFLNNKSASSADFIKKGDLISFKRSHNYQLKPYKLKIEIVFEDDFLVIVKKPSGLVVSGNKFRTLENAIQWQLKATPQADALINFRAAHRLDAKTSGLIIIAKTKTALAKLGELFSDKKIFKKYIAIAQGRLEKEGSFDSEINNKTALTHYKVLKEVRSIKNDWLSLVELKLETGRTHQIRIHLANNGNPILGDTLYAENTLEKKGLFLFAKSLKFNHPITNKLIDVELKIPDKFKKRMEREERMWVKKNKINS